MIDLRSDTVTRPTPAMRRAIAEAEVGDDVYHDDPTVNTLEAAVAEILGMEDAVYMPTGTMTNQVALRVHTEPGDIVLTEAGAHVYLLEGGAPGALSGLTIRLLRGERGVFTAEQLEAAIPTPDPMMPPGQPIKVVEVENTHNVAGGTIWPLDTVRSVVDVAHRHGLRTHLDGARLWNAAVATGVPEHAYAAGFDTVSVCFSKGLGAPMGSALAGSAETIARARRFKKQFGGGFRQAGMMAAGALHALRHHRERLAEDHANARRLADGLAEIPTVEIDPATVETNIVRFRVPEAVKVAAACRDRGVLILANGADTIRAVTHLDVDADDIDTALAVLREVVTG